MAPHLTVRRRLLRVQRVIGEATETKTVQATITLPVQAIKVFEVQATLKNTRCEIRRDGVYVQGIIHKQIYFVDQGDLVRHVPEDVPFHFFIDVEGADPGMSCQAHTKIVNVDWTLSAHGKEVVQDVAIQAFVKVTEVEQMEVVTDVTNTDITVTRELLRVESVVGEDTVRETIESTVRLPMKALKIFEVKAEVRNVTATVKEDLVTIKGVIHKQIFFVDEGNLVRHFPENVPFSISVDIPGAEPDMDVYVDVNVMVDDFRLKHRPIHDHFPPDHDHHHHDHDDHRGHGQELSQSLIVEAFVKVVEPLQIQVVTNVTGPNIIVERRLLKVDQVVTEATEREAIESEVTLPMQAMKIFSIMAELRNVSATVRKDSVIVRGTIHKQIFFVDMGNLLRHHSEDVPFRIVLDTPGAEEGMDVHVRTNIIGDVDWTLRHDNLVKQAVVVEAFVKVTEPVQLNVVVDVREAAAPPPTPIAECPTMRFHVVQPGESLWSIAQRYGVTLEALLAANPALRQPELVYPGQKVCIPPKVIGQG
ncbi:MAG: DUF3794 domain-containing protein [Firmicutes bacterium]|jgi:spore coat assembly protein SafA|nr:DUF3794 domain-containing protein [Bacillota bacterium]